MESTTRVLPKGGWQRAHPNLVECPHHRGTCAYRVGDPDRCDFCHASWAVVEGKWGEDRAAHLAAHTLVRERQATRPGRKPGQIARQTLNGHPLG